MSATTLGKKTSVKASRGINAALQMRYYCPGIFKRVEELEEGCESLGMSRFNSDSWGSDSLLKMDFPFKTILNSKWMIK